MQASSGVPIHTPAAPATSAPAIARPVAIPPAATTGRSVIVSASCSSGSIARRPVCPPASVPCTTTTSTPAATARWTSAVVLTCAQTAIPASCSGRT